MSVKITTSGKIFLGIIAFVIILLFASFYLQNPSGSKLTTSIYCVPDCSSQTVPIGVATLIKGCFINQTECQAEQTASQTESNGRILIGIKNSNTSIYKIAHSGSVTMLNLTIKQIYIRENNQTDWINVFNGSKTFNATNLGNRTAVIADTIVPIKTYSQEKIVLGVGQIKIYSLIYNNFGKIAYPLLPGSNETIVSFPFTPAQNETSFLIFDFSGDITHTADGYILTSQFVPSVSTLPNGQQPENSILIS
jgi:c-di-AMP phosphodiesterase-like protein